MLRELEGISETKNLIGSAWWGESDVGRPETPQGTKKNTTDDIPLR